MPSNHAAIVKALTVEERTMLVVMRDLTSLATVGISGGVLPGMRRLGLIDRGGLTSLGLEVAELLEIQNG